VVLFWEVLETGQWSLAGGHRWLGPYLWSVWCPWPLPVPYLCFRATKRWVPLFYLALSV
jgi:hypothetical protein